MDKYESVSLVCYVMQSGVGFNFSIAPLLDNCGVQVCLPQSLAVATETTFQNVHLMSREVVRILH
jgi:hypothetical protein